MNKYILIGAPHCGKSTLGQRAGERLQMPFYDTDILAKDKMGEVRFFDTFRASFGVRVRESEREVVSELDELDTPAIIATGAEVALIPQCIVMLQNMGAIIHIKRNTEDILEELKNSDDSGFALIEVRTGKVIDFREEAVKAYSEELAKYEAVADFTIDNNSGEDEGVEKLINLIQVIDKAHELAQQNPDN